MQIPGTVQPNAGFALAATADVVHALTAPGIHEADRKGQYVLQFSQGVFLQGRVLAVFVEPAAFRPLCTGRAILMAARELTAMAAFIQILVAAYQASGVCQAGNDSCFHVCLEPWSK